MPPNDAGVANNNVTIPLSPFAFHPSRLRLAEFYSLCSPFQSLRTFPVPALSFLFFLHAAQLDSLVAVLFAFFCFTFFWIWPVGSSKVRF